MLQLRPLLFYSIYFSLLTSSFAVNSLLLEDVQSLFSDKHCIEASLLSFSINEAEPMVLSESEDSDTATEDINVLNASTTHGKSETSIIHELAQYNGINAVYKLISEDGPAHAKTFTVRLMLGDENYEGYGPSLKKAKQEAASLALENTFYEHPPEKIKEESPQTPTVILNNIAMKLGIQVSYFLLNGKEEQTIDSYGNDYEAYGKSKSSNLKWNATFGSLRVPVEEPQVSGPFTVKVSVGDLTFKGVGHTIQGARHSAAAKAIQEMEKRALFKDGVCNSEDSVAQCKEKKDSLKSPITRVYETAQQHNLPVEFNIISESGKSHKKVFVTECKLASFVTEGEGTSKKESKKAAAVKMLKYLPQLPHKYNENTITDGLSQKKKKKRKKKNKMIRENEENIFDTVSYMASSLWTSSSSDHDSDQIPKKNLKSPKEKILELGSKLNIVISFTDLGQQSSDFFSLMSLGVHPPHLCLGQAVSREKSHETAALHGLKYLQKSGVFEQAEFAEHKQSYEFEDYDFEKDVGYEAYEDAEIKE